MALGAGHLAKAHWMHRGHKELLALLLVAFKTDIRLGLIREDRISGDVDSVATGTGNVSVLMATAFPCNMLVVMMAGQTHAVLLLDGFIRLEAKIQYWWPLLSRSNSADMPPPVQGLLHRRRTGHTRPMTGLALQLGKGRTLIALLAVFGLEDIEHRIVGIFIMTFDAGIGAFFCEGSLLHIFHGGGISGYRCWSCLLLLLLFRRVCRIERKPTQENQ